MGKRTQERILVLVDYLISLCRSQETDLDKERLYGDDQLYEDLVKLGFDSKEINMAFELILKEPEKIESRGRAHTSAGEIPAPEGEISAPSQPQEQEILIQAVGQYSPQPVVPFRPVWIFGAQEQIKLSPQLRGELLRLYLDSYLTTEEMFEIVNYAMGMDCGEIKVTDLAYLISRVIKESTKVETLLTHKELRMLS
jgi:uncharacterized protein Smg (DUF494 family)